MTNETSEKLRQEAAECEARREESFQRCDTDGFVSQWASGLTASLKRTQAQIIEDGGVSEFTGLYEGDRRVKAQMKNGQFGSYWLLHEDEKDLIERRGKPFLPVGSNSRVQKKLGLSERKEHAPAYAKMTGTGTGLSGNVWVGVFRGGDFWGQDSELIDG